MPTSIGTTEILVLLFLLAAVVLIVWVLSRVVRAAGGGKICPHCAETIKAEAVVCRFCGRAV